MARLSMAREMDAEDVTPRGVTSAGGSDEMRATGGETTKSGREEELEAERAQLVEECERLRREAEEASRRTEQVHRV